ncbi:MAG: hypothetical protein IKT98_06505 [Selenomonadaceae bacterium]|nr:hypothetical protein [Selenomonadaceae bacterium]
MKKICAGCGVEYEGRSNSIYCSRKCKNKHSYKPRPLEKKICAGCGKEFETPFGYQKYCSYECKRKHNYEKSRERPPKKKICPICGAEFETNISYQKYCSKKCSEREKYYRAKAKLMKRKRSPPEPKPTPTARHCLACGSEYEPKFNNDRFCSDDCRMSWYRPEVINAFGKMFYKRQ